jgi:hypothetical protein
MQQRARRASARWLLFDACIAMTIVWNAVHPLPFPREGRFSPFPSPKLAAMRSPWIMILRYFPGSALIVVIALGLARALVIDDPGGRAAKTLLDERIETARQIRRALETPVPPPEPLPAITAKPARVQKTKPGAATDASSSKAPQSARDLKPHEQRGSSSHRSDRGARREQVR